MEAKFPTIWTDGSAQPGRNSDIEKVRRGRVRREKMQVREKGRKVSNLWLRSVEK